MWYSTFVQYVLARATCAPHDLLDLSKLWLVGGDGDDEKKRMVRLMQRIGRKKIGKINLFVTRAEPRPYCLLTK